MMVRSIAKHLPDGELILVPFEGRTYSVERGKTVEVPDELGASLLEQTDAWAAVGEAKKAAEKVAS